MGQEKLSRGTARLEDIEYDLSVMHVIHGLGFAFGFQELAEALYQLSVGTAVSKYRLTLWCVLLVALTLTGLRLFWAISNIRRFVERKERILLDQESKRIVLVYFPLIVLQAFLFYISCRFAHDLISGEQSLHQIRLFCNTLALLLGLNALWLVMLNGFRKIAEPEKTWLWNNSLFVVSCILAANLPAIARQPLWSLSAVLVLLLLNCFCDLGRTAKWYVRSRNNPVPADGILRSTALDQQTQTSDR